MDLLDEPLAPLDVFLVDDRDPDRLADQRPALVAEDPIVGRIRVLDEAIQIALANPVGHRVEDQSITLLRRPQHHGEIRVATRDAGVREERST